ncbi:MAG: hypothetical protein IJM90_06165 [Firmicutes bacterium]|nr:hypothetical protein [Bacillota bacterium]
MFAFFYILNAPELLDELLAGLKQAGIQGATIFQSTGMARVLNAQPETGNTPSMLNNIHLAMTRNRQTNMTIMSILTEEQVHTAVNAIESIVGSLAEPSHGLAFTLPIQDIWGLKRYM